MATTDPAIASGPGGNECQKLRPDETIVAETSRVTHAVPGYVAGSSPFVEPARVESDLQGDKDAKDKGQGDDSKDHNAKPAHPNRPGWISIAIAAVVALAFGVGGAWAYSHFSSSKDKDQSQEGDKSRQAKKGGDDSSRKDDSSNSVSLEPDDSDGSTGDSVSANSRPIPAEDARTLKKQIESLSSRFDLFQQKIDTMSSSRDTNPPDLASLQIKVGELSGIVNEAANRNSRSKPVEDRLDRLQEEIRELRNQFTSQRDRIGVLAGFPPIVAPDRKLDPVANLSPPSPTSIPPSGSTRLEDSMSVAIALFKKGQYQQADEAFRKLQLSRSQDARVWYYSALAHGFATGQWEGETRKFVVQGADQERAGLPSALRINEAFADLSTAQGKDWLSSYRLQLVKK